MKDEVKPYCLTFILHPSSFCLLVAAAGRAAGLRVAEVRREQLLRAVGARSRRRTLED
jgi:hypothetical protein